MPSCTWRVPAKATRGSTVRSFRRGSRVSRRLTFSWAPSGGGSSPDTGADSEAASSASSTRRSQAGVHVTAGPLLTVAEPPDDLAVPVDRDDVRVR